MFPADTVDEPPPSADADLVGRYGLIMTVTDICGLLKVSVSTVHRYMREQRLPQPVDGFGRHMNRWRTRDVAAWYDTFTLKPGPGARRRGAR